MSRERDRFRRSRRKTPLHPAGGLVRPAGGAVDHPDRPSAGRSWGELVRTPLLDRVGVQSLPPATTGGRSRAWVGNGKRPACRDRRTPLIVNTASPGGWPASSWDPPPRRFPTVTQRPPPHGTGLAACRVDPLTQRLEGPGTGRSGAEGMPGRTHFRPGPSHGGAVTGSQGLALAFFSVWPTSRA